MNAPYVIPPVGTILPAKQNTSVPNPGMTPDKNKWTEWDQACAQDQAYIYTGTRAANYFNYFRDTWLYNYQIGRSVGPPPPPPPAVAVEVKEAEAGGVYFDLVDSPTQKCCEIPDYAKPVTSPSK